MSRFTLIIGAIALVCIASGIEGQLERCHTAILTPHHFLDLNRFKGRWYPLMLAPSKAHQVKPLKIKCASTDFTPTENKDIYGMTEDWTEKETGLKGHLVAEARLNEVERPMPAIWVVHYNIPGTNETGVVQTVTVAADEDEWALEYSCQEDNGELLERLALWSRQRTLDPKVEKVLNTVAYGLGFPYANFQSVEQTNC